MVLMVLLEKKVYQDSLVQGEEKVFLDQQVPWDKKVTLDVMDMMVCLEELV